MALTLKFYR